MKESGHQNLNEYSDIFSKVYNLYWSDFIDEIGPSLIEIANELFHNNPHVKTKHMLDLCCGSGRLATKFLENQFNITGIDLSPHMISIANKNNIDYVNDDKAEFIVHDVINYKLDKKFLLITSTFDSLNHMKNIDEFTQVIKNVYRDLLPDGIFIFDLNTEKGLKSWEFVDFEETDDLVMIFHGKYDRKEKVAYSKVYGFLTEDNVSWRRFDQLMTNTVFNISEIELILRKIGFKEIWITDDKNLFVKIDNPEEKDRIFIFARK